MTNRIPTKWDAVESLMTTTHPNKGYDHIGKQATIGNLDGLSIIDGTKVGFDWNDVENEIIRLQAEYDAQEYARNRQAEYPSLLELTVALYDTDDKSAVEAKRAAVKLKYPKPE